jgi:hypothetical protein
VIIAPVAVPLLYFMQPTTVERCLFSSIKERPPFGKAKTAKTAVVGISHERNGQCDLARLAGGSSEE